MKKKTCLLLVVFLLTCTLANGAMACTGIIAGKDVTADGSAIMGRSEDIGAAYHKNFIAVPALQSEEEVTFTDEINGFSMPLPGTSFGYTMTPDVAEHGDGIYAEACMNEHGVAITATISAGVNDAVQAHDPLVENGLREASLPTVVIPYVKTAREGVQRLGEIIETYGSAEGNIVFIGDAEEIWYVEILSGHQWAAVKVPDDVYAVVPNCFMLGNIDLSDTENVMASAQVLALPEEKGFLKTYGDKPHLALTYGEELSEGNRQRAWGGKHFFSPAANVAYDSEVFELFSKPDQKIALQDAMNLLRYRYEGTEYDVNEHPELRAIGTERTSEAHLYQYKPGSPLVQWLAMGNPEHSVFLPAYPALTQTPAAYQIPGAAYQPESAFWTFRGLSALAELDRVNYGQGVRDYWAAYEAKLIAAQAETDALMLTLADDPAAASNYANEQFAIISADAMEKANVMYDELMYTIAKRAGAATMKAPYTPSITVE